MMVVKGAIVLSLAVAMNALSIMHPKHAMGDVMNMMKFNAGQMHPHMRPHMPPHIFYGPVPPFGLFKPPVVWLRHGPNGYIGPKKASYSVEKAAPHDVSYSAEQRDEPRYPGRGPRPAGVAPNYRPTAIPAYIPVHDVSYSVSYETARDGSASFSTSDGSGSSSEVSARTAARHLASVEQKLNGMGKHMKKAFPGLPMPNLGIMRGAKIGHAYGHGSGRKSPEKSKHGRARGHGSSSKKSKKGYGYSSEKSKKGHGYSSEKSKEGHAYGHDSTKRAGKSSYKSSRKH